MLVRTFRDSLSTNPVFTSEVFVTGIYRASYIGDLKVLCNNSYG